MRNKIFISLCALITAGAINLKAQSFDYLSAGLGVSVSGASVELATPVLENFQLRAGFSMNPGLFKYTYNKLTVPYHPGLENSEKINVPVNACASMMNGHVLFDWHPVAAGPFYVSVGLYAGSPKIATAKATGLPSDYNTIGYAIDETYTLKAHDNVITVDAVGNVVKPYLGIGIGRPTGGNRAISVAFDLGACYIGKPRLYATLDSITESKYMEIPQKTIDEKAPDINKYSGWMYVLPMASFHVYYNIF